MSDSIVIPKKTIKLFGVIFIAAILGSYAGDRLSDIGNPVTGQVIAAPSGGNVPDQTAPQPPPAHAGSGVSMAALAEGGHVKGDPNAPITLIEWSDFECPFCGRFYDQSLPQIEQNFIDQGVVKLVYKHFPLSFHPNANPAAEASECAAEQGEQHFFPFHDRIFEQQTALGSAFYEQVAGELDLNLDQFRDCVNSGKYRDKIQADFAAGSAASISGTPGFYLGLSNGDGQRIVGAQPYQVFESAITSLT